VIAWACAAAATLASAPLTPMSLPLLGIALFAVLGRTTEAVRLWMRKTRLLEWKIDRITLSDLERIVRAANPANGAGAIYLGIGFDIDSTHTRHWHELRTRSIAEVVPPPWAAALIARATGIDLPTGEQRDRVRTAWIDAVEPVKRPLLMPVAAQAGHTFVVGTTGAGKTTLLLTVLMQRALQGAVVITIDPKGDHHMEAMQREVARRLGRPFVLFDPARPSLSDRLSLLANFNRYTELPSRIVATLAESDFKAFGWCFVSRFVAAMLMVGEKPDISKIKRYIVGGSALAGDLLERCIGRWMGGLGVDPESIEKPQDREGKRGRAQKLIAAYRGLSEKHGASDVIDGLISTFEHDKEHYQKVTLNLVPVLEKLTAGDLAHLFSPNPDDLDDRRRIWDVEAIVNQRAIVYVRLDSLSDSEVASTIGSMLLSSIVAVAGARYNQGEADVRVSVNVDEVAEVVNIPFIQLENKGRGALFDLTFFSQSVQDITARMGSSAFRDMVLENANNVIAFRVSGEETVKFVQGRLGTTEIGTVSYGQSLGQRTEDHVAHYSGSVSRTVKEKEVDLFPRDLLARQADFSYVGYFSGGRVVKGRIPIVVGV
jgi:conjugal transfer pilus assembly protein TraD